MAGAVVAIPVVLQEAVVLNAVPPTGFMPVTSTEVTEDTVNVFGSAVLA